VISLFLLVVALSMFIHAEENLSVMKEKGTGKTKSTEVSVGPYALYPIGNTINIRWFTVASEKTFLSYYKKADGASTKKVVELEEKSREHNVTLKKLEAYTEYEYVVGGSKKVNSFRSAAAKKIKKFSFIVFGDPQSHKHYREVIKRAAEYDVDFAIGLGDLVSGASDNSFKRLLKLSEPLFNKTAFFPIVGNHDYRVHHRPFKKDNDTVAYDKYLGDGKGNYYAFEYGRLFFIALNYPDAKTLAKDDNQFKWLAAKLKEAKKKKLKVVLLHHCPCFTSTKITWCNDGLDLLPEFLDKFRKTVAIDFAGHIHTYERSIYPDKKGITYITTGGAGELYDFPVNVRKNKYQVAAADMLHFTYVTVNENNIEIQIIDVNGKLYEKFVIEK